MAKSLFNSTLRTIEEFDSPEEILIVLRDIVEVHKQEYIASGQLHRAISPSTIFISETGRGVLPYPHETNLHCFPANPIFASVSTLARSVLGRKKVPVIDHLDDLEAVYYTLVFLATAYRGPRNPMTPSERAKELHHTLSLWINNGPVCAWSVLEKEVVLLGQGFGYGTAQPYCVPFVFETLFEHLNDTLNARYTAKMDKLNLGERVDDVGLVEDEESEEEKMENVVEDYDALLWSFDYAIEILKDVRILQKTGVPPPSIAHLFEVRKKEKFAKLEETGTDVVEGATEESLIVLGGSSDESDDSSNGTTSPCSSLETSPVEENDEEGDLIKRGI